jgi:hypothetical protein
VVGLLVLLFIWNPIPATGKPLGILAFTVLALVGTYILIRQTAVEFPETRSGAATLAIRSRVASMRQRREQPKNPNGTGGASTAEQLERLATLRDRGAITPDEYETAKRQLLSG